MTTRPSPTPAMQAFQIRPTPPALGSGPADELMIDWSGLPRDTRAAVYLPAADADDILALAAARYVSHPFTRLDANTLGCAAAGTTYPPIPVGSGPDYAGLLTVTLPAAAVEGQTYTVTIRQITSATNPRIADADEGAKPTRADPRRVLGTFQHSFTVKPADQTLAAAERLYAVFQWIDQAHPSTDRWSPVLARYLAGLGDTITILGGNPALIPPSWTGFRPEPGGGGGSGEGDEVVGKIEGVVYDRFGDFDGFLVRTGSGPAHRFHSREPAMRILIERAWAERTRIAVRYEPQSPHIPAWVILLAGGHGGDKAL